MMRLRSIVLLAWAVIIAGLLQPPLVEAGQDSPEPPPPQMWATGSKIELDDRGTELILESLKPAVGLGVELQLLVPRSADGTYPEVTWPDSDAELGDFEVLGAGPAPPPPFGDRPLVSTWTIRTFASGLVELPGFNIGLGDRILEVPARTIRIASVAGIDTDPAAHRDITGPIEVKVDTPIAWLWFLLGYLLLVAAIIGVVWWWHRPRPTPPPIPADTWAFAELEELESRGHLPAGRIHRFYIELTDITRRFIELRYGLAAPERTTPEFVREATRHPQIGEEHARVLGNLLRSADMVKFAGDRPASAEAQRHLGFVRDFVGEVGAAPTEDQSTPANQSDAASTTTTKNASDHHSKRQDRIRDAVDGLDQLEDRS